MIQYINSSADLKQVGFIGDSPDKLTLRLFVDSDFAGDRRDMKSTSGVMLTLWGPHSFFPLGSICKKQTAMSNSSSEAEMIAMHLGLRKMGYPALDLWDLVMKSVTGKKMSFEVWEDNQTCAAIVRTGKTNELRHVHRVHGVNICALHDAYVKKLFTLKDCHTKAQAADIFTKYFTDVVVWKHVRSLVGMVSGRMSRWLVELSKSQEKRKVK